MNKNGITLVALVVTVIILLIISAVAISLISGENGLFTKANEAGTFYNEEARKEANLIEQLLDENYIKTGSGTLVNNNTNPGANTKPLSNGSFNAKAGHNTPDVSQLPRETTKYVTWTGTNSYSRVISPSEPDNWYDYKNGQWANILTNGNGLEAYWVWIPRFAYKLPESATATEIEVIFLKDDTKKGVLADGTEVDCYYATEDRITTGGTGLYANATDYAKGTNGQTKEWIIHPAFWWDNNSNGVIDNGEQLKGLWFAKFKASNNGGKIEVINSAANYTNMTASNTFNLVKEMKNVGGNFGTLPADTTLDTHLTKNIEWGAVAILSQSKYGVFNPKSATGATANGGDGTLKVWNTPNAKHITGSVGTSADAAAAPDNSCYSYNRGNGLKGSTTGTVYGIYDMTGSAWELVMAVMENTAGSKTPRTANSSFTTYPDSKYYDLYGYATDFKNNSRGKIGDLTSEIKPSVSGSYAYAWNSDITCFIDSSYTLLGRGGGFNWGYGTNSGIFAYTRNDGSAMDCISFRPVLIML